MVVVKEIGGRFPTTVSARKGRVQARVSFGRGTGRSRKFTGTSLLSLRRQLQAANVAPGIINQLPDELPASIRENAVKEQAKKKESQTKQLSGTVTDPAEPERTTNEAEAKVTAKRGKKSMASPAAGQGPFKDLRAELGQEVSFRELITEIRNQGGDPGSLRALTGLSGDPNKLEFVDALEAKSRLDLDKPDSFARTSRLIDVIKGGSGGDVKGAKGSDPVAKTGNTDSTPAPQKPVGSGGRNQRLLLLGGAAVGLALLFGR